MPLLDGSTLSQVLIAFVAIGVLALILRWVFGRDRRDRPDEWAAAVNADADEDFGLLSCVAVVETEVEAHRVRALLADYGIRATTSPGRDGRTRVLVFRSEVDRARNVGGWSS